MNLINQGENAGFDQSLQFIGKVQFVMDNFMDKLAQKFNAQEVIKANSQAETAEMKRLQLQVAEYESILQEMRKLNYKNVELTDKIQALIGLNAEKLQDIQSAELNHLNAMKDLTDEQKRLYEETVRAKAEEAAQREQMQAEEAKRREEEAAAEKEKTADAETLEGYFRRSDEYLHKENIKVYRNVQAVVIEEMKNLTDKLVEENDSLKSQFTGMKILQIFTILLLIGSFAINLIQFLGIQF